METLSPIEISAFATFTLAIVVFFLGDRMTDRFAILKEYSIPEPVTGGIVAALITLGIVTFTGRAVVFDLAVRDFLLVYFFTTIGLNARLSDLAKGGPLLVIMLVLTVGYMFVQNFVGVLSATMWGLPKEAGVMLGTASLIGGHGTSIAWGPIVQGDFNVPGAAELGIATATLGLITASLLGGPIAKFLIVRNKLAPVTEEVDGEVGVQEDMPEQENITSRGFMWAVFWIHIAIVIGFSAHESLKAAGVNLPLFVPCLLSGILLSNTVPHVAWRDSWPARTATMTLISEYSLSLFLAMSLMSMELWALADSAGVLATTIVLQAVFATAFILLVVYRAVGGGYFGAVISAGFTGVTLGATPTAIANMSAVTHRYGPSPLAFIVLPLISAFFVDIANAFIIQMFLN